MKTWLVSVWDGHSTNKFTRVGTYEQVANTLWYLPPGYIWSIS